MAQFAYGSLYYNPQTENDRHEKRLRMSERPADQEDRERVRERFVDEVGKLRSDSEQQDRSVGK